MVCLLKKLSGRAEEGREDAIPDMAAVWMDLMGFHPATLCAPEEKQLDVEQTNHNKSADWGPAKQTAQTVTEEDGHACHGEPFLQETPLKS